MCRCVAVSFVKMKTTTNSLRLRECVLIGLFDRWWRFAYGGEKKSRIGLPRELTKSIVKCGNEMQHGLGYDVPLPIRVYCENFERSIDPKWWWEWTAMIRATKDSVVGCIVYILIRMNHVMSQTIEFKIKTDEKIFRKFQDFPRLMFFCFLWWLNFAESRSPIAISRTNGDVCNEIWLSSSR